MTKRPLDESGQAGNSTGQATHGQQNNEINQPDGGNLTGGHSGEPDGQAHHKKASGTAAQAPKSKQK